MPLLVASEAFANGEHLATKHSCEGSNVSPPLRWTQVPDRTESLAVICEDHDAPDGALTHWVLYDLPPETQRLAEGSNGGGKEGVNSFRTAGYSGPCPAAPAESRRYVFRVIALGVRSIGPAGLTKEEALEAFEGHILAEGTLTGRYQLRRRLATA